MAGDINTLSFARKYDTQTIKLQSKEQSKESRVQFSAPWEHVRLEITLESFLNDAIRKNITIRSKETRPQERLGIVYIEFLSLCKANVSAK